MKVPVFKALAGEGESVSQEAFLAIFDKTYIAAKSTTMTDMFDVSNPDCKTVLKVEPGMVLTAGSEPKTADNGMIRIECKAATEGAEKGWVTIRGNTGAGFLNQKLPHTDEVKALEA